MIYFKSLKILIDNKPKFILILAGRGIRKIIYVVVLFLSKLKYYFKF